MTVQAESDGTLATRLAPVFVVQNIEERHNRIGTVRAMGTSKKEAVVVDPEAPAVYAGLHTFATGKGDYTNLVYRVHFLEQPFSLIPFHLGAGKHVGVLVVLTLDTSRQVVLVTTANTCGCYAISVPTAALPEEAFPDRWPVESLTVYGERLPAHLPKIGADDILQVVVRPEVHRVMDLRVVPGATLGTGRVAAPVHSLDALNSLPLADGTTTSFYHDTWPLTGHVKGAIKPWETLLLSLVSLDLFVGMDKEYGDSKESGNPFYTSLKPWNRRASDMNDFAAYLRFNGWRL